MEYKFTQKKNLFMWGSKTFRVVFDNPCIQGFNDYTVLKDMKDVMYFDYGVKIYKTIMEYKTNPPKEKEILFSEVYNGDVPNLQSFLNIINFLLKDNVCKNGQIDKLKDGDFIASKSFSCENIPMNDFYELKKTYNSITKKTFYDLLIGIVYNQYHNINTECIRIPFLSEKDIVEFKTCIEAFFKYSIEQHNKDIEKSYEYCICHKNKIYSINPEDKDNIEEFFVVGDNVDITTVYNNEQKDYTNIIIEKIENDKIYTNNNIIDINSIVFITNNINEQNKILYYNIEQCAEDFLSILDNTEKIEFQTKDIDYLVEKYNMTIINRTWLCREEHNFNIDYNTGDNIKAIQPIVKLIIKNIKNKLNKN